jgi:hypothetical protein
MIGIPPLFFIIYLCNIIFRINEFYIIVKILL